MEHATDVVTFRDRPIKKLSLRERFKVLDGLKQERRKKLIADFDAFGIEKEAKLTAAFDFDGQPVRLSELITHEGQIAVAELRGYADLPMSDEESLQLTADLCGITLMREPPAAEPKGGAEGNVEEQDKTKGFGQP